jgi:hypothetical protein
MNTDNTLVWGLIWDLNKINHSNNNKGFWTYINYHRLSIKTALDLNYNCHIYISENIKEYFKDLDVNIHIVTNINSSFFDFITNYILKSEHKNCYIIDGDVILNKRLPDINSNIICEQLETNVWDSLYEPYVNSLNKLNVTMDIKEWTGKKYSHLINMGILKIKDNGFIETYLNRWDAFNSFIEEHKNKLYYKNKIVNTSEYTIIGAQYLLTELLQYYKLEYLELNKINYTTHMPYYVHYMGKQKFTNGLVPYNDILQFKKLNIL